MTAHRPIEVRLLVVVDEMMFRRMAGGGLQFRPQGFVFQHAIEKCTGRVHAAAFGRENPLGEQAQGLGVALESAVAAHQMVERAFSGMTEWRVAKIVREADGLDQIRIDEKIIRERTVGPGFQPVADGFANLCNF